MGKSEKLFSTALGGFKKSEVVEYIEDINRKAKATNEQYEFEISRLGQEVAELEKCRMQLQDSEKRLSELEQQNKLLEDDVENQRKLIEALQAQLDKLSAMEADYEEYKAKALKYDEDIANSGGILQRAKAESARILASCNADASEILHNAKESAKQKAQQILEESERQVAENLRKVKYLYQRRDELLDAFEKVKNAAGGFYDSIASTLSGGSEDK